MCGKALEVIFVLANQIARTYDGGYAKREPVGAGGGRASLNFVERRYGSHCAPPTRSPRERTARPNVFRSRCVRARRASSVGRNKNARKNVSDLPIGLLSHGRIQCCGSTASSK